MSKKAILKIKTEWNLNLLYKSASDPQIERDLKKAEGAYKKFAKQYQGKTDYLQNEGKLSKAIRDFERLTEYSLGKPYMYFHYRRDLSSKDKVAEAKLNLIQQRLTNIDNLTTFFVVSLSAITPANQKKFLASSVLKPYRYFLKVVFNNAAYILSEKEERVINLKFLPAHDLWVKANDKQISSQRIEWKGKRLAIPEVIGLLPSLGTKDRRELGARVMSKFKEISDMAEAEVNAVIIDKKINDELRGFKEPHHSTVLFYQNELETVASLVKAVTKNYKIAHRFYRIKAKMMGLKSLHYADRGASIGKAKKEFSFEQAVETTANAFKKVGPFYHDFFRSMLENGQVDVWPKPGKTGGAYCSHGENLPIYVLLNHVPNFNSVTTLAHEMGHAIHSKLSTNHQRPLYRDYTIATAEVASTFFENTVFDEILATLSPKEQVIALHNKINDSVQTIFRQIAFFNFEMELHRRIRAEGKLSKEEIAKLMNKHMSAYLGPIFKLSERDGFFFVYVSHIRRFFYVYTYAFGELVSSAIYQMYKDNPGLMEPKLRQFLSAGGSASPEDIFRSLGINVRQSKFFETGLKKIEREIIKLEKLVDQAE